MFSLLAMALREVAWKIVHALSQAAFFYPSLDDARVKDCLLRAAIVLSVPGFLCVLSRLNLALHAFAQYRPQHPIRAIPSQRWSDNFGPKSAKEEK